MKTFLLRLPDELHREIKTNAAERGITMQEYMRVLLIRGLPIIVTDRVGHNIEEPSN